MKKCGPFFQGAFHKEPTSLSTCSQDGSSPGMSGGGRHWRPRRQPEVPARPGRPVAYNKEAEDMYPEDVYPEEATGAS